MDCSPSGSSVCSISRQEYWNALPFPASGELPDPRIEPTFLVLPALADGFFTTAPSREPLVIILLLFYVLAERLVEQGFLYPFLIWHYFWVLSLLKISTCQLFSLSHFLRPPPVPISHLKLLPVQCKFISLQLEENFNWTLLCFHFCTQLDCRRYVLQFFWNKSSICSSPLPSSAS